MGVSKPECEKKKSSRSLFFFLYCPLYIKIQLTDFYIMSYVLFVYWSNLHRQQRYFFIYIYIFQPRLWLIDTIAGEPTKDLKNKGVFVINLTEYKLCALKSKKKKNIARNNSLISLFYFYFSLLFFFFFFVLLYLNLSMTHLLLR